MIMLEIFPGEVKQYVYRTARVAATFLNVPLTDDMQEFERQLATAAQARPDNHTVYEISHDGKTVYVQFSDRKVMFGLAIAVGRW